MQLTPINKHFNACDQKWDAMPEQGNGRHCQQCDRVLVDLTDKTEQQVLDLQKQHNFKLCGRYTLDQVHRLDRYLTLQEQPKRNHMPWLVKLAMGLGTSGLPLLAAAQEPLPDKWIEQALPSDTLIDIYPGYHSPWVKPDQKDMKTIFGAVMDSTNGEPIPFANVTIVDMDDNVLAGTATDFDGWFELTYQEEWLTTNAKLKLSCLGYIDVILPLSEASDGQEYLTPINIEIVSYAIGIMVIEKETIEDRRSREPKIGVETYYFDL